MSHVTLTDRAAEVGDGPSDLGQSGVGVSVVGLGGLELGPEGDSRPDPDHAASVIAAAIDAGMNWLDTSENYLATRNESLIGEALALIDEEFFVTSKVAPGAGVTGSGSGFRPDEIHAACRDSLARLRRDQIDAYLLHHPAHRSVPLDETWGAMAELAEQGLVRAIGMSNYFVGDIERCHAQRPVDVIQDGLSLVDHLDLREKIRRCGELGIAATVYEPLAGGVLSGKTAERCSRRGPRRGPSRPGSSACSLPAASSAALP